MYNFVKKLQEELNNSNGIPMFEIGVVDNSDTTDFVTCDISFKGNSIIAQRDAVSTKEEKSKYIAQTSIVCDSVFSLDEHLAELYGAVVDDIVNGDLYAI